MTSTSGPNPEKNSTTGQPARSVLTLIKQMAPAVKRALPKQISPQRFVRVVFTAVRTNPRLQASTPESFLAAMMQAAQLGLEPNTPLGQAYLIPYYNRKLGKYEAQFQIGYQGLLELAYRTGEYRTIYAMPVYANDQFEYQYGLDEKLLHIPAAKPEGEPVSYYAVYHLRSGGHGFVVMSREQLIRYRDKYSVAGQSDSSAWKTDFDSMAKKTVLKQLLKYAPKSAELIAQLAADESVEVDDVIPVPAAEIMNPAEEERQRDQPGQCQRPSQGQEPRSSDRKATSERGHPAPRSGSGTEEQLELKQKE